MSGDKFEPVSADCLVVRETEKALLVEVEGEQMWVPKSQLLDGTEVSKEGDAGALVVPAWLAKEKGII